MRLLQLALLSALATLLIPLPIGAQGAGMSYAPGASQYRVHSVLKQTRDVMGQTQEDEITTTQLVSVEIERGVRDTMHLHIVLDSVHVQAEQPTDMSRFVGVRVSGTMSPRGKVYELAPPPELADDQEFQTIVLSLRSFLVGLPPSTRAGTAWSDTTDTNVGTEQMDMVRRVITQSTLTGDTSYAGQRAHRIQQQIEVALSGTANADGYTVVMAGSGTGSATYFVSNSGVYLGARSDQQTLLELSVGEMKLPITQTMSSTVQRVR